MASQSSTSRGPMEYADVPAISNDDDFVELMEKLADYFTDAIVAPHLFEDFRSLPQSRAVMPLISYLSDQIHHPALISALLALKVHFTEQEESSDEPGVNETRGLACEFVAWQFLSNLSEREAIDLLLCPLPPRQSAASAAALDHSGSGLDGAEDVDEETPLFQTSLNGTATSYLGNTSALDESSDNTHRSDEFAGRFEHLSALEIAAVSEAKKFMSQRPVQRIISGVWCGNIIFWESLNVSSVKCPKLYNARRADPFLRLRVPRYLKVFETLFFTAFLGLYYAVLVERSSSHITSWEILLYVWVAGFAYEELGDWVDSGQTSFYASDFWWIWDISIVLTGLVFLVLRVTGLATASTDLIELAYDVLGLEALFLVPRIFALLSLNTYFGTLIPCLKEMTKDFVKFLSLVVILYLGFLTTFIMLARGSYKPREMTWILIKVFFGSSYLGFDVAQEISPYFGPPVMLVFVALTNILLITSLISLLSNSLTRVLDHAREEYLFVYSVYVLEASTSKRLTFFLPPLNLIPLVLRPLRIALPSEHLRSARIMILKATHFPFIGLIWAYESFVGLKRASGAASMGGPQTPSAIQRPPRFSSSASRQALAVQNRTRKDHNGISAGKPSPSSRPPVPVGHSKLETDLESLIVKLTSQVEQLTASVSQLQGQREGNVVA